METLFYLLTYLLVISMMFSFDSVLMFMVLVEINMALFTIFINGALSDSSESNYESGMYYMVIQLFGSSLLVLSFFMDNELKLFMLDWDILTLIAISLKMGIIPFHFWIFKLSKYMSNIGLYLLLTLQKIPFIMFLFTTNMDFLVDMLMINMILGSYMLLISYTIKSLLVSSSIYSFIWFYLFFVSSFLLFFLFFMNYMFFLYFMLKHDFNFLHGSSSYSSMIMISSFLFIVGLPPLGMFFFKYFSMDLVNMIFSSFSLLLLVVFTFISTMGYFNFFFLHFTNFFYIHKHKNNLKIYFFLLSSFSFFFFF